MSSLDLLLKTMDPPRGRAWHGGVTPVGAVRGVSAALAKWRPAPKAHSIWELTLHIAYWKYAIRRNLEGGKAGGFSRSPSNWPALPARPDERTWKLDRQVLSVEHAAFSKALRRFRAGRLLAVPEAGRKWTFGDLIAGILAHDAYHTGQIQLIKRLWKARATR